MTCTMYSLSSIHGLGDTHTHIRIHAYTDYIHEKINMHKNTYTHTHTNKQIQTHTIMYIRRP